MKAPGGGQVRSLMLHSGHVFVILFRVGFIQSSFSKHRQLMKEHFDQRARPVPSLFHENLSRLSVELVCV